MTKETGFRRWRPARAAAVIGLAVYGVGAAKSHALGLLWLPAVLAGAAWPPGRKATLAARVRRARGRA